MALPTNGNSPLLERILERLSPGLVPAIWGTVMAVLLYWVSIEVRYDQINERLTTTRNVLIDFEKRLSAAETAVADPSPKAQTKIELDDFKRYVDEFAKRVDRVEDRLGNLHWFIMQQQREMPPATPPSPTLRKKFGEIDER